LSRHRTNIVLCAVLAMGGVLIARLAHMQLILPAPSLEDLLTVGRPPLLETTRGAIYTADGVLLARDVVAFDLSVRYCRLVDALLPRDGTASEISARYEELVADEEDEDDLVKNRPPEFDLPAYCRRLIDDAPEEDWVAEVSRLTGSSRDDVRESARAIVRRYERMWWHRRGINGREDPIREQVIFHAVAENIPAKLAVMLRTHAQDYPDLRAEHRAERVNERVDLAPHVVGYLRRIDGRIWRELQEAEKDWTHEMPVSQIGQRYLVDDQIGAEGIERSCEDLLRGRRGYLESLAFFEGPRVRRRSWPEPPRPGLDVHLTLRADFQEAANETLQWATQQPNLDFRMGAIVLMDARSGAVLAAGTYPTYRPKERAGIIKAARIEAARGEKELSRLAPLLFRPIGARMPIGSVFKLVTAIAALQEGKITPATTFHCAGSKNFAGRPFRCAGHHRDIALLRAIEKSCNLYFFQVAARLTGEEMAKWGRLFGLGSRTGVDLSGERRGLLPTPRTLHGRLNLAIGQGELVCTPLQVARLCAAIANGGTLVQPHLFDHATDGEGRVAQRFRPQVETIPVRAETLRLVREGMHRVVLSGTASRCGLEAFDAAGKTGTAELEDADPPNHAWFAGFAPFESPKIAFAVVSERTHGHGSDSAAIMAHLLDKIRPEIEKLP